MTKEKLPIQESLKFGWEIFKKNPRLLIVVTLLFLAVNFLPSLIDLITDQWLVIATANILGFALSMLAYLGIVHISFKLYRKDSVTVNDIWSQSSLLLSYFGGSILYGLLIFVGLLLFVVPGIIWAIRYFYFSYILVDEHISVMAALKKSAQITKGWTWGLLLFGVLQMIIMFAGLLVFGVGIVVVMPVVFLAEIFIYHFLLQHTTTSSS